MPRIPTADTPYGMIPDLRTILDGWDYEPGKISVRRIIGRDGQEKIQTRIDLGVLQIAMDGRPDGCRPQDHESYLDPVEQRLAKHIELYGDDEDFLLTPEDMQELRRETYLYYQRYLSCFVLEDFERVIRDTARNLRVVDLCEQYGATREDRLSLTPQRPYVLMMHTRARAGMALGAHQPEEALAAVDAGIRQLCALPRHGLLEPEAEARPELHTLQEFRQEIIHRMPPQAPARLESELQTALACEDFERAAQLRDALRPPADRPQGA
jgi:hypothetical protein